MNFTDNTHADAQMYSLLEEVYLRLGYRDGVLLDATRIPIEGVNAHAWLEKGDWLSLAQEVGAEKVLFVNNDPVFIFYQFNHDADIQAQLEVFRRIWCMARPQCLFMALPGELRVYNLNQAPARNEEEWKRVEPLAIVEKAADVAEKLKLYHREQVESGYLFADNRFGKFDQRADKRLIQDLKAVRASLRKEGLELRYAHTLIGRSIFIRYLEDRGILTPAYFQNIVVANPEWQSILGKELEKPEISEERSEYYYSRILTNKDLTFALFRRLAEDFNGDMFPEDKDEENAIQQDHLTLLRGFLLGDVGSQQNLFFWAYNFKIIPIDLISSIYEEFYHESNDDDKGTHYTPSVLVEYILSQVLNEASLDGEPKILDPACGSGIFLVESFRRIVRYKVQKLGKLLTPEDLRYILQHQLSGFEINGEAIRVAAFSLYLALLHYQEPRDILNSKRLPKLIYSDSDTESKNHYNVLFNTNTFALMKSERKQLSELLQNQGKFLGRSDVEKLYKCDASLYVQPNSFDIIVGNPPWGFVQGGSPDIREAQNQAKQWCAAFNWQIGDKEASQTFIARTFSLIKPGGVCGLLISTGILFKHHENSQEFRKQWLSRSTVEKVVNFVHVRHAFFSADSPFTFVQYKAEKAQPNHLVQYWSVKKTRFIDKVQIVILDSADLRQVRQFDLLSYHYLWKVYWWGSHRDAALVGRLRLDHSIGQLVEQRNWKEPRQGFTPGSAVLSDWLKKYKQLPVQHLHRYGPIDKSKLKAVPDRVHRRGVQSLYEGWRLLIKRGISQAKGVNGRIVSRLDHESFCFSNSVHGISLDEAADWERQIIIAILWSSLARYYYFMIGSSWGTWHHEIHLEEAVSLPIRFPEDPRLRDRIVELVGRLQSWTQVTDFFSMATCMSDSQLELEKIEMALDEAIFDLYKLDQSERDLVNDMCNTGLDFFYNHVNSMAIREVEDYPRVAQGYAKDIQETRDQQQGLEVYLSTFLRIWNRELEPEGEFSWQVIRPANIPMIAVVFTTQEVGAKLPSMIRDDRQDWEQVLVRCSETLLQPVGRRIFIDGIVRVVSDTDIIIIKRDERRLWTGSVAREDAEATLLQAIHLQAEAEHETKR